jgi:tetratricopeptide (TPR) repeat protein
MASGDAYFKAKEYYDAAIQYSNVIRIDNQDANAHFALAKSFEAINSTKNALVEYVRAADLAPDNSEMQIRAARFLVNGNYLTEAKNRMRAVLKRDPKNIDALIVLGTALAGLSNADDAVAVLDRAVHVDPERAGSYTTLGVMQIAHGELALAEQAFTTAVTLAPTSADAYINLGTYYRTTNRLADAERALLHAYQLQPKWERVNQALIALYIQLNRLDDAERYLKALVETSTDPRTRYALADFLMGRQRFDEARAVLFETAKDKSEYATAMTKMALLEFAAGSPEQSQKIVDDILAKDAHNSGALSMKARLLLAQKRPADALEPAKLAVDYDQRSASALLTLGRVYRALNSLEEARKTFNDVLKLDPHSLPTQLELAEIHRSRNEVDSALEFAEEAANEHKDNVPARLMLIRTLLIRDDDYPRAGRELDALLSKYPNIGQAQALYGALALGKKDPVTARRAFERAVVLDPRSGEAVTGLVICELQNRNKAAAAAYIEKYLAASGDVVGAYLTGAKLYGLVGDNARVEQTLKRALKADPSNPQIYDLLGRAYIAQGRLADAKNEFAAIVKVDKRSVQANTMLGWLYYTDHDRSSARQYWERAVELDSGSAAAANNLAWLYAEGGGNLDVALQMALTAKGKYPAQPEVNDTLGWVYYKKALYSQAIYYIQQSVDVAPNDPVFQFHLGMAYAQKGDDAQARKFLKAALTLKADFEGAQTAKQTLSTLVY